MTQDGKLTRRRVLGGALAAGLGGVVLSSTHTKLAAASAAADGPRHLVWVWQFSADASPDKIGLRLHDRDLGVILKTHDGIEWMAQYDKNAYAVSGPAQVKTLIDYYETAGIPFHAWTVVHGGADAMTEARMAADVLAAGARSIYLDVEGGSGFWRGNAQDALAFGAELRRLQPNGRIVLSIDPRPWTFTGYPLKEFASFSDAIAPQQYWRTFNTPANVRKFQENGYPVPPEGVTPEFLLAVSKIALAPLNRPLIQVGQGATPDSNEWKRFMDTAYSNGSDMVTVWRYGVTTDDVFNMLVAIPPKKPPPPPAAVAAATGGTLTANGTYIVASGDSLSAIAAAQGVSLADIANINGLADPYPLYVGQELKIPGAAGGGGAAAAQPAPAATSGGGGNKTYVVASGDTLGGIATKFGTTAQALVDANGLPDANTLSIGQELKIP